MAEAAFFVLAALGLIFGGKAAVHKQVHHAEAACHCRCGVIAGEWPTTATILRDELLEPGEAIGKKTPWMAAGPIVCLTPDEAEPARRFRLLQQRADDRLAAMREAF